MTHNNTTARLLTALTAVLMIATTASAQLPGVGVPDPAALPGTAQGLAGSLADVDASAGTDGSSVDACASAATSTSRVAGTATGLAGAAPVPVPALPVAAPSLPGHSIDAGLCVDSEDPEGSAMNAAGEAQEQAGQAQGFLAKVQGWAQGIIGGLGLPF